MAQIMGYHKVDEIPARKFRESRSRDAERMVREFHQDKHTKSAEVFFEGKADSIRSKLSQAIKALGLQEEVVAVTRTVNGVKKVYITK